MSTANERQHVVPSVAEQGAPYESSIMESPPPVPSKSGYGADTTPVAQQNDYFPQQPEQYRRADGGVDYFAQELALHDPEATPQPPTPLRGAEPHLPPIELDGFDYAVAPPRPSEASKPILSPGSGEASYKNEPQVQDQEQEQGGYKGFDGYVPGSGQAYQSGAAEVKPQYTAYNPGMASGGGGLRVANASPEEEWPPEAVMAMRARDST